MPILTVMPTGHTYIPEELKDKGYKGKLEAIPNACVLIIPKPGSKNYDVAESLETMATDFRHKARLEGEVPTIETHEIKSKKALNINDRKYDVYLNLDTKRFRMEPIK